MAENNGAGQPAGSNAAGAAAQLRAAGLAEVYVLAGGLNAWRAAGLPLKA